MPTFFLRDVQISRGQRVLLVTSFASSICITIITIPHSILLFLPVSSTTLLMAHIKAALSVIICNLLVILTFIYRVFHKTDMDLGGTLIESVQLTTIIPGQLSLGSCSCPASPLSPCTHSNPSL
ncbi:hypothetical protein J3R82DRAFT_6586 [Butyriboletus roseoflavus]|nr:hypothetical protein J3R82DRAFT_6586 [Butyriboletus roseoflavus]